MTGVTVKSFLIVFGAVLACTAPFVHIVLPKKSTEIVSLERKYQQGTLSESQYESRLVELKLDQKMMGFSTPRRFWYAIGLPITLFFFASLFLLVLDSITDKSLITALRFSGFILFFIAVYHLVWVVWPGQDLPKNLYHLAIALTSVASSVLAFNLILRRSSLRKKIGELIRFISIDAYHKYVQEEDKDDYLDDSFTVYDDITK